MLTHTPPQAYDTNAIYSGLSFTHTYVYDTKGNQLEHQYPNVTRGVPSTQSGVKQVWTYNAYGQVETHTDENGNKTTYTYHTGPTSSSNDINDKDTYAGYLASVTTGATGSTDTVVNATTSYKVNKIGMRTETTDANSRAYTTEYFNAGDVKRTLSPTVTLFDAATAVYETRYFYDRAGHRIRTEVKNIDVKGNAYTNAWIKTSSSFDAIGKVLKVNREVDSTSGNDIVSEYGYDDNDRQIATMSPLGQRSFTTYDERGMTLRSFSGVSAPISAGILENYPAQTADTLSTATATSRTLYTYDARGQTVTVKDGLDHIHTTFYDFAGRAFASRDPNGNGSVTTYDDAGQVLTSESGVVNSSGVLTSTLSRSYRRYDERGRAYLSAQDANLGASEASDVSPSGTGANPMHKTEFDKGGRTVESIDALNKATTYTYDAANRRLTVTACLGANANYTTYTYDPVGNVLHVDETERPDNSTSTETFRTSYIYDELRALAKREGKPPTPRDGGRRAYGALSTPTCRTRLNITAQKKPQIRPSTNSQTFF